MPKLTPEEYSAATRKRAHDALDTFLDGVMADQPNADDGEEHVFRLTGARVGYGADDSPLFDFALRVTKAWAGV